MKFSVVLFLLMLAVCGCEDSELTPSDAALKETERLIGVLTTNSSVRCIRSTTGIRTLMMAIGNCERSKDAMHSWKTALFGISFNDMRPSDRYGSVREVSNVLMLDLVGAIWDKEGSYEDVWSVRFETIAWLEKQCCAMRPNSRPRDYDWREEMEKWNYYGALVEYRECLIENLELNGFDDRLYHVGEMRINAAREEFEHMIGRRVRPAAEIKKLGFYAKQARARVLKERDAALKKPKSGKDGK